jgi:esterase
MNGKVKTPGLHVRRAGEGPPVVLLHGLFGSGANLGTLARSLRDRFSVYSPDLPNHGRSAWLEAPDLSAMADALRRWMTAEGLQGAHLVGHSLGGKVAMQMALEEPARVLSLVVADIAPVEYPPRHDGVFTALAAVADGHCASREAAAGLMARYIEDERVIQFLLSSLERGEGDSMAWRFDLRGIESAYRSLSAAPQGGDPYPGAVLFIKGGASDYIQEAHRETIRRLFPAASVTVMPECGHWLHAEKPQLFNGIVGRFIEANEPRMLDTRNEEGDEAQ